MEFQLKFLHLQKRVLMTKKRPNGYWQCKENCIAEAMKYTNFRKFTKESQGCYNACRINGWINELTWMERNEHEKCIAQYTLDGRFIRTFKSYNEARKVLGQKLQHIGDCCRGKLAQVGGYRWLFEKDIQNAETIFRMKPVKNIRRDGYTEEELLFELLKYHSCSEYEAKDPNRYNAALRMGITNKFDFEGKFNPYKNNMYCVYVYEFCETKTAYVGVTKDKQTRDKVHRGLVPSKRDSSVLKYAKKTGLPIPSPIYLDDNISPMDATVQEGIWDNEYRANGWIMLNKAKTGKNSSSLGACRKISTKKIKESASKYEYIWDFIQNEPRMYNLALKRNIVQDLGLKYKKPYGIYTEERCYYEAAHYKTVTAFKNEMPQIYQKARKNGWLNQYWWLTRKQQKPVLAVNGMRIKIYHSPKNCYDDFEISQGVFQYKMETNKAYNGYKFHYLPTDDLTYEIPDFKHRLVI